MTRLIDSIKTALSANKPFHTSPQESELIFKKDFPIAYIHSKKRMDEGCTPPHPKDEDLAYISQYTPQNLQRIFIRSLNITFKKTML